MPPKATKVDLDTEKGVIHVKAVDQPSGKKQGYDNSSEKQSFSNKMVPDEFLSNGKYNDAQSTSTETGTSDCAVCLPCQSTDKESIGQGCNCKKVRKKFRADRIAQKLVFVFSVTTLLFLAVTVTYEQWLVWYFYAVAYPILMIVRLIIYWKLKWQFYMLDLCYFVNWAIYIYIWACPWQQEYLTVVYSLSHGPVALACFLFRNSLVLHSTDKMTSCALHVLPLLVTFGARWYPESVSEFWYTDIVHNPDANNVAYMAVWLWTVPFGCFLFHALLYLFLLKVVFRPGEQYDYSFKYLSGLSTAGGSEGNTFSKIISCCLGPNRKQLAFVLLTVLYGLLALIYTPLLYRYFIANCIFIAGVFIGVTWNGAQYYVEVFGPKTFD